MNAANTSGTARQATPGRLARFEDDDADQPAISLPPRTRRKRTPLPAASAPAAAEISVAAAPNRTEGEATDAPARPARAPKGPEDKIRPSNVHIPVNLLEPLTAKCQQEGLSHGEVIIIALETAYPRLNDLIHPPATAGGSLFASRRSRASRSADGPLTPLNYRLRVGDFDVIDGLVEEFRASSRGQLITAALNDYFGQT